LSLPSGPLGETDPSKIPAGGKPADHHYTQPKPLLTGNRSSAPQGGGGCSLTGDTSDQVVAKSIPPADRGKFASASLQFGIQASGYGESGVGGMSCRDNVLMPPEVSPSTAYRNLFGVDFTPPPMNDAAGLAAFNLYKKKRKSVLDNVLGVDS